MNPTLQIQALAQSVYLRIKNRKFDDINSVDGQTFVANIIDFANGYLDELELELTPGGAPVYWKSMTQLGYTLGTAAVNTASISLPSTINEVITQEDRYVQVQLGGAVVSNWLVVSPSQITNRTNRVTEDMCTVTGSTLTFSRQFKAIEDGGTITGDVTLPFPRLTSNNAKSISIIKPRELLVLGIAKNSALPDIVKGSLTPSFVQKYQELLADAIERNQFSARGETAITDNYGYVRGVF